MDEKWTDPVGGHLSVVRRRNWVLTTSRSMGSRLIGRDRSYLHRILSNVRSIVSNSLKDTLFRIQLPFFGDFYATEAAETFRIVAGS
jgi:hypothetical protein